MLKTTFEEKDNSLIMHFEGQLDTPSSAQAGKDMKVLYDEGGKEVILDCTKLEYIASSGLRLFLQLLKHCHAKGTALYLKGLNANVMKVFAMTGLTGLFKVID